MTTATTDATARRPVIGICARTAPVVLQGADLRVSLALASHVQFLANAGSSPVLLPLTPGIEQIVERLDGLLIPGGPDLDPALYGAPRHERARTGDPAEDRAEHALLRAALAAGIPVLGICRGMQLINVCRGGTLHQHLPEAVGNNDHCPQKDEYTLGKQLLTLQPGSRAAGIFRTGPAEIACHHHQGVDRIGDDLIATARAADGVIEMVEAVDHPFVVGVQWEAGQTPDERFHQALSEAASRIRLVS